MSFTHTQLPRVDKRVHRLGIALNMGLGPEKVHAALDRGVGYVFAPQGQGKLRKELRDALRKRQDDLVIATGPSFAFRPGKVASVAEKLLGDLGVDTLDVFQLHWMGKTSSFNDDMQAALHRLKDQGKARAVGTSIHDRPRAGELAAADALDLFMIRYNAAHPGAETDIFPHLRGQAVVAYTATAWRKLLKPAKGWTEPLPTPGDLYRFCLSSPHVHVVLCGPKTLEQLDQNLAALEKGPLSEEETAQLRAFGAVVHG